MGVIIPEKARVDYSVAKEKLGFAPEIINKVDEIRWIGSVKPGVMEVSPVVTDNLRYEEIQIIRIVVNTDEDIYEVGKTIFRKIKYPVLLQLCHGEKYLLGVCLFHPGKLNREENILHYIEYSHWIREEYMSVQAKNMVDRISILLDTETDLHLMYKEIEQVISGYKLGGTTKSHVNRLLKSMLGKMTRDELEAILAICEPYKYYIKEGNRYTGQKSYGYMLIYDYEELWYCFMKNQKLNRVITARRYRDMEDLIYSIESKEW